MAREILRRVPVEGGEDYMDYDGDEEAPVEDEEWQMFNDSFNW